MDEQPTPHLFYFHGIPYVRKVVFLAQARRIAMLEAVIKDRDARIALLEGNVRVLESIRAKQ